MAAPWEQRLQRLLEAGGGNVLAGGARGVEKESLRVTEDGAIAQSPHPRALGSALTNPYITTDFSEALLEFVTPPYREVRETLEMLEDIHGFVHRRLDDELLWAASMPCAVEDESAVPIARYGSSHSARMKEVYRRGLAERYGRRMQAIAGVHFNWSAPQALWAAMPEALGRNDPDGRMRSACYMGLVRNFKRLGWLVPYLFGCSPAVCASFLAGHTVGFEPFGPGTWYRRHATSLRMSDVGYKNRSQALLAIDYSTPEGYVRTLRQATETPSPEYEVIGVRRDGEWLQLNTSLLQIENEYYGFIRPKQPTEPGERPVRALAERGIAYVEVRALDLDPFEPCGVPEPTVRFLEPFLIYCLLAESPPIDRDEHQRIDYNERAVALRGREPGLRLRTADGWRPLTEWAGEIMDGVVAIAEILDAGDPQCAYRMAVRGQAALVGHPEATPSARLLEALRESGLPFARYVLERSREHRRYFLARPMDPDNEALLEAAARESWAEQARLEAEQAGEPFEAFLARYYAQ